MLLSVPIASAGHVGAYNVELNSKFVKATAKCSCGLQGNYNYHTRAFLNYCPNCHRYGTLCFEEGAAPYTSPEGMWYCSCCDMDYCCVDGKSHDNRGVYLIPYVPKKIVKKTVPDTHENVSDTITIAGVIIQKHELRHIFGEDLSVF